MYVCIDAGHGGPDRGAAGFGAVEKWITAEVALRAGELLHAGGCLVFLTRVGDRRVSLPERLRTARDTGAELFLSLHCGQSLRPEPRGLTVFHPRGDICSQAWAEAVLRAAEARISGHTVARGAQPLSWRSGCGSASLLKAVGARMPACLVELGCLSNPHDARLLQQRLFLDDLARGLAGAVLAWQRRLEQAVVPEYRIDTKTQRTQRGPEDWG
jgi:N-acetylmuramoyl-L-alanine amidase